MIDRDRVESIFVDCLFLKDEDTSNMIKVEGIQMTVGFNPVRVEKNKEELLEISNELDKGFESGMSFVNLCEDRDKNIWSGEHRDSEKLMLLLMAIGRMKYVLSREYWNIMPYGVPAVQLV